MHSMIYLDIINLLTPLQNNNTQLSPLSIETVIGATIKQFDRLLYSHISKKCFLDLYYKHWLHRYVFNYVIFYICVFNINSGLI